MRVHVDECPDSCTWEGPGVGSAASDLTTSASRAVSCTLGVRSITGIIDPRHYASGMWRIIPRMGGLSSAVRFERGRVPQVQYRLGSGRG